MAEMVRRPFLGAFVWRALDHALRSESASLYTLLASNGIVFMVVACLFLGTMSIVGDLVGPCSSLKCWRQGQ